MITRKDIVRLGIGIPLTDDRIHSQFFDSWVQMEKPEFVYMRPDHRGPIDEVRNLLVTDAMDNGCTHLIMLDTDQFYPKHTIPRLLSYDLDAVGALVYRRYPPFDPVMYRMRQDGEGYEHVHADEMFSGGLVEVDATGCGCVMFKMDVFLKVPPPWFVFKPLDGDQKNLGEDVGFCAKLRSAGYKIFVDTSLEVEHLATMSINRAAFELYQGLAKRYDNIVGADAPGKEIAARDEQRTERGI